MSAKIIPDRLRETILKRIGNAESTESVGAWLSQELGRKVDGRRVRDYLDKIRKERAPIAQAIIAENLSKTLTVDLSSMDALLKRSVGAEARSTQIARAAESDNPELAIRALEQMRRERAEQRALLELRFKLAGATEDKQQGPCGVVILPAEKD